MIIKQLRAITGLTQVEFAEKFDINISTLRMWEQGVNNTPSHIITMVKRILELEGFEIPEGVM